MQESYSIREVLEMLSRTGESSMILCKNEDHKNTLRTLLSRERMRLLKASPESRAFAKKVTSKLVKIGKRNYLKIYLKEALKIFSFDELGNLYEVKPERSKIDRITEKGKEK